MTYRQATTVYGIPDRTLFRDINDGLKTMLGLSECTKQELVAFCSDVTNLKILEEAIASLDFVKTGRKTIIPTVVERDLLAMQMELRDSHGYGLDRPMQIAYLGSYCEHMGASDCTTLEEAERFQKAKCSRAFIEKNFFDKESYQLGGVNPRMTKNSDCSFKRAAAANPTRASVMTRKFQENLNMLIAKEVFPSTGPSPYQVENYDEMGCDPWGQMNKVFSLLRNIDERRMNLRSGEKAEFWASILFGVNAGGELKMPTVIHKGGTDGELRGDFTMNLDPRFKVDCTPSGYASKITFRTAAATMLEDRIPKFVYLDGHESHFDPIAGKALLDADIYPNYLRSHGSICDQALDNGPNAMMQKCYFRQFNAWKVKNPGEPLTPPLFNLIFTKAWHDLEKDPKLEACIIKAFKKTNTWPLVDVLAAGSISDKDLKLEFDSNVRLSSTFNVDEKDQMRLEAAVMEEDTAEVEIIDIDEAQSAIRFKNAKPGSDNYQVLVSKGSRLFFEKSFLEPAVDQAKRRAAEKALRKVSIPRPAINCLDRIKYVNGGIPDTVTGHCATHETYELVAAAREQKDAMAACAVAKRQVNLQKRRTKDREEYEMLQKLLEQINTNPTFVWAKATLPRLKAAYNVLPKDPNMSLDGDRKKEWYVARLQLPMQAAIAEGIVAPGEQDPADIVQDDQSSHADSDMEEEA
jgi:hypothetical protein